jgi:micrococcal nuclease
MGRRALCLLVLLVVACALASCSRSSAGTNKTAAGTTANTNGGATVERVVDGDTIIVHISGRRERVRFIGIDTPESVKPNTPVQCFALEASARTKALLPAATPVRLVGDVEPRDKYKRLLAYLYRSKDNLFVNLSLVRDGYAQPYTFPPNVAHTNEFVAAAADARQAGRGLWSACR